MKETLLINYRHQIEAEQMPAGKKKTLLAAIDLFAQHGFDGTSTAQLAEKAQVSQATIFKYFKTKQDILLAIIQPLLLSLKDDFWQELYQHTVLEDVVHFIVTNRLAFFENNQDLIKILIQECMVNPVLVELIKDNLETWQDKEFEPYIQRLKQENQDLDQELTTWDIMGLIGGNLLTYFVQRVFSQKTASPDLSVIEKRILLLLRAGK